MFFSFGLAKYVIGLVVLAILYTVIPGVLGKIVILGILALFGYYLYVRKGSDG